MKQILPNNTSTTLQCPSAKQIVATILLAQNYASKRLHYLCRLIAILCLLTLLSSIGTFILWTKPPSYKYILTDQDGGILNLTTLSTQTYRDSFVINWTIEAILKLYSIDYVNYRAQLQSQRHNLTTLGWKNFQNAMKSSGNFQAILGNQYFTTAKSTGSGTIIKTGRIQERFAWKIKFPLEIVYQAAKGADEFAKKYIIQELDMNVTVVRVPRYLNSMGLGIRAIIAEQTNIEHYNGTWNDAKDPIRKISN